MSKAVIAQDSPLQGSVLLVDSRRAVSTAVEGFLSDAGCLVETISDPEKLLQRATEHRLVVLAAGLPEIEAWVARLKAEVSSTLPVLLLFDPGTSGADERCFQAGADSYLVAPLKRDAVVATARDLLRIGELLGQIKALEDQLDGERLRRSDGASAPDADQSAKPPSRGTPDPSPVYDFEFFKRLLLMEVKRSKRYAYPISLALLALDDFAILSSEWSIEDRSRVVGAVLSSVSRTVRDIDLPVLYAEERILIFMPHTARDGALIVGGRLRDGVRETSVDFASGERVRLTACVGMAAFDGRGQVSFSSLIKDATLALRRAQAAGGDRVESSAAPVRDRVSIG